MEAEEYRRKMAIEQESLRQAEIKHKEQQARVREAEAINRQLRRRQEKRNAWLESEEGKLYLAHKEYEDRIRRDLEAGVNTPEEIRERERLHQEYLKDGKDFASVRWSGEPKIEHGRRPKYIR
jgi:hypothetical protein